MPTRFCDFFMPLLLGIMFSGCPSVHPSEARNTLFPPVYGSVGPSDQPSIRRPSGEVSGHFPETAWREWPEILLADVSWPPSDLIRSWSRVCWLSSFWPHFDLVKWVKFGVSGHFPENAWSEWPAILHADASWPLSEVISLWSRSGDFSNFCTILT